jgi:hypothetical protein
VSEERTPGRYHAEHVQIDHESELHKQLQGRLNAAEEKEWHLVSVAGGLPHGAMVLFWDTKRPSFGRSLR